jgi:CubicO group peptidase (beta-lactamase class C family)
MFAIRLLRRTSILVVFAGLAISAQAPATTPRVTAVSAGISAERLERLHQGMQGFVDRKEVSGIVTLVAREGKLVDLHAVGLQDIEKNTPMKTDSIFRIASMSKPITSVAIMMLYEEGKLFLSDPVSKFIPAFKSAMVMEDGKAGAGPARDHDPRSAGAQERHHLWIPQRRRRRRGLSKNGVTDGLTLTSMTLEEGINKLAAEPLVSHPGAAFNYSLSTDVLGRVVEVVSGQPYNVFLRERIFKPLKMIDTDFIVPEAKWSRFVTCIRRTARAASAPMNDPEAFGNANFSRGIVQRGEDLFLRRRGSSPRRRATTRGSPTCSQWRRARWRAALGPKTIEMMTISHTSD